MINVGDLLIKGAVLRDSESRWEAASKAGVFRGGSVGLLMEDGSTVVGCPRAALARYIGADPPRDPVEWAYTGLMLESGKASEELWYADLVRALEAEHPGYQLLREDEFKIEWKCIGPGGKEVVATGREDLILVNPDGKAELLVELKQVSALNTACKVLGSMQPKLEHTIQAANYSYRTGVPVQLWYVSRVKWSVPDWSFLKAMLGNPHPRIERFLERSKTTEKITSILPFIIGYQVYWAPVEEGGEYHAHVQPLLHDGSVDSKVTGRKQEKTTDVVTPITASRIDRYYSACVEQLEKRRLFPHRPKPMEMNGKTHTGYNPCDYCDWQYNCDDNENDFEAWLKEVESHVAR